MPSPSSPAAAAVSERYSAPLSVSFSFLIRARAAPGVVLRVLELFAKRGVVPQRWNGVVSGGDLCIDIRMSGFDRELAEYIARCMRQIHDVETVFTIETDAA